MGPVTVTEGTRPGAIVLMEFPSREHADNWYNSAAYQKILPLRVNSAIFDIVLIDELPEGFTVKPMQLTLAPDHGRLSAEGVSLKVDRTGISLPFSVEGARLGGNIWACIDPLTPPVKKETKS